MVLKEFSLIALSPRRPVSHAERQPGQHGVVRVAGRPASRHLRAPRAPRLRSRSAAASCSLSWRWRTRAPWRCTGWSGLATVRCGWCGWLTSARTRCSLGGTARSRSRRRSSRRAAPTASTSSTGRATGSSR